MLGIQHIKAAQEITFLFFFFFLIYLELSVILIKRPISVNSQYSLPVLHCTWWYNT